MGHRFDLGIRESGDWFVVRCLFSFFTFGQHQHDVILTDLCTLKCRANFAFAIRSMSHRAFLLEYGLAVILRATLRGEQHQASKEENCRL